MEALTILFAWVVVFLAANIVYEVFTSQFYILEHDPMIGYVLVCDFSRVVGWCQ